MNLEISTKVTILLLALSVVSVLASCSSQMRKISEKQKTAILIKENIEAESASIQDYIQDYVVAKSSTVAPLVSADTALLSFSKNRAFYGAPPRIPHRIDHRSPLGLGKYCLSCHEKGGFAVPFSRYVPVTPHPKWVNCRQCHVPSRVQTEFRANNFVGLQSIQLGKKGNTSYLPGAPPRIPHSLENRANCHACHSGPGANFRIRTSHPERTHCRQCHVPVISPPWRRAS